MVTTYISAYINAASFLYMGILTAINFPRVTSRDVGAISALAVLARDLDGFVVVYDIHSA